MFLFVWFNRYVAGGENERFTTLVLIQGRNFHFKGFFFFFVSYTTEKRATKCYKYFQELLTIGAN